MVVAAATSAPLEPPVVDELGERLLDAAAEVFAERGYDGAGVAEIARRAGVTTGAIYSRFAGKADLLVAAIDATSTDELDALFADHRFEGRMEDIIRLAGSHLVESVPDTGTALLLEAFVAARRNAEVAAMLKERMADRRARLVAVIEGAKADGGISDDLDTDSLVAFCHAVGFGFLLFGTVDYPMPSGDAWTHLITHLVTAVGRGQGAPDSPTDTSPTRAPARPESTQES